MALDRNKLDDLLAKALHLTERAAWLEEKQIEILGMLKASTVGLNSDELKAHKPMTDLIPLLQKDPKETLPHLLFDRIQITLVHLRIALGNVKITE